MRRSFQSDLEALISDLLLMGNMVEKSITNSVIALKNQDKELAQEVIKGDDAIDAMELKIERECLNLIARQQPIAKDLRKIAMGLKIITDLERIADHASDIAKVCLIIADEPLIKPLIDIPKMAEKVQLMLRNALDCFVDENVQLAYQVCGADDEIDNYHKQIFRELLSYMLKEPQNIKQATQLLLVSNYLERIADHVTNLGEWLIYMVTGERKQLND